MDDDDDDDVCVCVCARAHVCSPSMVLSKLYCSINQKKALTYILSIFSFLLPPKLGEKNQQPLLSIYPVVFFGDKKLGYIDIIIIIHHTKKNQKTSFFFISHLVIMVIYYIYILNFTYIKKWINLSCKSMLHFFGFTSCLDPWLSGIVSDYEPIYVGSIPGWSALCTAMGIYVQRSP